MAYDIKEGKGLVCLNLKLFEGLFYLLQLSKPGTKVTKPKKQQKSIKEANEIQQKVFNSSELENIHQWLDDNSDHLARMNHFKLVLFHFKLLDKLFV